MCIHIYRIGIGMKRSRSFSLSLNSLLPQLESPLPFIFLHTHHVTVDTNRICAFVTVHFLYWIEPVDDPMQIIHFNKQQSCLRYHLKSQWPGLYTKSSYISINILSRIIFYNGCWICTELLQGEQAWSPPTFKWSVIFTPVFNRNDLIAMIHI